MNCKSCGFLPSELSNNVVTIKINCKEGTPREPRNNSDWKRLRAARTDRVLRIQNKASTKEINNNNIGGPFTQRHLDSN